jgi:hypothetical protein
MSEIVDYKYDSYEDIRIDVREKVADLLCDEINTCYKVLALKDAIEKFTWGFLIVSIIEYLVMGIITNGFGNAEIQIWQVTVGVIALIVTKFISWRFNKNLNTFNPGLVKTMAVGIKRNSSPMISINMITDIIWDEIHGLIEDTTDSLSDTLK